MSKFIKVSRFLHRELGYFYVGMFIIYAVSGIALNHKHQWNPNYKIETFNFKTALPFSDTTTTDQLVNQLFSELDMQLNLKSYYFPGTGHLKIFMKEGAISINTDSGEGFIEILKKRPILKGMNYLHYNSAKRIWTWFSDIFCVSMIIIAISGLFLVKGKKGLNGRGGILLILGILIPLILFFLLN